MTFSFGGNWLDYLRSLSEDAVARARADIEYWVGEDTVRGASVLDVGSGSGIHSLAFLQLGARRVCSFDVDPRSVDATRQLWERAGRPAHWEVLQGSILDPDFTGTLGTFDLVYAWGVLHHTGALWEALARTCTLVRPGGRLWVAIYTKGPSYAADLALKRRYNAASPLGRRLLIYKKIGKAMLKQLRKFQNPLAWNQPKERGMDVYHDIVDWLGGLPYEVASPDEVVQFTRRRGFVLERIKVEGERANSIYVLRAPGAAPASAEELGL